VVFGIDKEYDSRNFGEVVFPETAGCCSCKLGVLRCNARNMHTLLMSTQIKGCKLYVANGEFFGCCGVVSDRHVLVSLATQRWEGLLGCRVGWRMATRSFCAIVYISNCL